ncbi:hypothetical protein [Lacticaseibacillus chiayiensis]|uniref:Uncharacterized protein n=1 Tax=Lacticaseibacillus chiayiensis TaxID=2100821 RepID=A0ABY6H620_9LACO|nr:hypothetical protein [Lacticaseibacillus chiayiensis]QVI35033.1 hypothetical protein KG086_01435 [Lacticaseibacillus chiayiensis]UYN56813.1 hypothetical protein OFW50_01545 [Lacticaseibacillus chiayiensis]
MTNKNKTVRVFAEVNPEIKEPAQQVLSDMGLDMSTAALFGLQMIVYHTGLRESIHFL